MCMTYHVLACLVKDYYHRPRVIKSHTCFIDRLAIDLGTDVETFETELCELVSVIEICTARSILLEA